MKKRGSLTVEAAIICPIFIFAVFTLIGILSWFHTAEKAQQALSFETRNRVVTNMISDREYIKLHKSYKIDTMTPVYAFYSPKIYQMAKERAFIGIDGYEPDENDPIVYMTPSGEVVHCDKTCMYLTINFRSCKASELINTRNRAGSTYYPCSRCATHVAGNETVYVTGYGRRYHTDMNCTAISRRIITLRYSQVKGMRMCSQCGNLLML